MKVDTDTSTTVRSTGPICDTGDTDTSTTVRSHRLFTVSVSCSH